MSNTKTFGEHCFCLYFLLTNFFWGGAFFLDIEAEPPRRRPTSCLHGDIQQQKSTTAGAATATKTTQAKQQNDKLVWLWKRQQRTTRCYTPAYREGIVHPLVEASRDRFIIQAMNRGEVGGEFGTWLWVKTFVFCA